MLQAFKLAEKAFSLDEVPVGAVVVCYDRIIGKGYNQCESLSDATAHAEVLAVSAASNTLDNWRLNECEIYVTKEPCSMCAGAIINSRLKKLVYGLPSPKYGAFSSNHSTFKNTEGLIKNTEVYGGFYQSEISLIMREFFEDKRTRFDGNRH